MEIPTVVPAGTIGVSASCSHEQTASFQTGSDLICFSHLRWHFVTQRPQHLLEHAARDRRVFYWEEPIWHSIDETEHMGRTPLPHLEVMHERPTLWVLRPHLVHGSDGNLAQRQLLDQFLIDHSIRSHHRWYYTPMALDFSRHLQSSVVIYDCMDELTGFLGAPPELSQRELELFSVADVVFTGGISLYEKKRHQHRNVHAFPSSIDQQHFAAARGGTLVEPEDQKAIPHPRAGFYGVVDERFDIHLLGAVAELRPNIQFIILGPVVKIDPTTLPLAINIHYLGPKTYNELPAYLAWWDTAILPFALNDSTRYISPTKTPEYLAAGKTVVSTPIRDVVRTYGDSGLVSIADTSSVFAEALDHALEAQPSSWREKVSESLNASSWDSTWSAMQYQIQVAENRKREQRHLEATQTSKAQEGNRSASHGTPASTVQARIEAILRGSHGNKRKASRARKLDTFDYLVVGAGFAGSVVAERLASQLGKRVMIIDKREHLGGNAYDHYDQEGILVHKYGPHIFHTNSDSVVNYLSQFTQWRPYEHRVLASISGQLLPIPINLDTINQLYNLNLNADSMRTFLERRVETASNIRTSEQIVLSRVGRELYELFFRNYTRKQWGLDPSELDASVAGRIPVRFDHDDRYFTDSFQAMPLRGYTHMFERMLDHPFITVRTGVSYDDVVRTHPQAKIIYTGPIDEYFGFRYGPLPYRSLAFKHETHDVPVYQRAPVINFPNEHEYTRVTEFKYLSGQQHAKTSIVYEYPQAEGDPYYPIPRPENAALFERYRQLAKLKSNVHFCGRLANYKYFNMDQVVAQALNTFASIAAAERFSVSDTLSEASPSVLLTQSPGLATA